MRYTISLGLLASDPENLWDRPDGQWDVPDATIEYCRGLIRSRFPSGGRETRADSWWQQKGEPSLSFYVISGLPVANVVALCALLARMAHQDAILLEVQGDDGAFEALLVDQAGAWSRPDGVHGV